MKILFQDIHLDDYTVIEMKVIEVASEEFTLEGICGILAVRYGIPCDEAFSGFRIETGPHWITATNDEATYLFTNLDACNS